MKESFLKEKKNILFENTISNSQSNNQIISMKANINKKLKTNMFHYLLEFLDYQNIYLLTNIKNKKIYTYTRKKQL